MPETIKSHAEPLTKYWRCRLTALCHRPVKSVDIKDRSLNASSHFAEQKTKLQLHLRMVKSMAAYTKALRNPGPTVRAEAFCLIGKED
jgi:hypothetical protein